MPKKTWKASHGDLQIKFSNEWSFSCRSKETLWVNGQTVSVKVMDARNGLKSIIGNHHRVEFSLGERTFIIEAQTGSKWFGLAVACHLYVDGVLVGGDVHSKLLFAKPRYDSVA